VLADLQRIPRFVPSSSMFMARLAVPDAAAESAGETGVHQQSRSTIGTLVTLGKDELQAIRQCRPLQVGELRQRRCPASGSFERSTVEAVVVKARERRDLEHVVAIAEHLTAAFSGRPRSLSAPGPSVVL